MPILTFVTRFCIRWKKSEINSANPIDGWQDDRMTRLVTVTEVTIYVLSPPPCSVHAAQRRPWLTPWTARPLSYLLTYSTVQSPSWDANWFAASQEIPRISRNQKVHYRTHKRPPPVCILGQPNPVHIPTSHLLVTHPNIIHPSMPRSPQWSPSLRFSHRM